MDNNQKLSKLFESEQFKEEASKIQTAEELQALFASHDVELTMDEVIGLCGAIAAQMGEAELSEDDLENVAGGIGLVTIGLIGLGAACIGGLAVGIYNGYRDAKNSAKK